MDKLHKRPGFNPCHDRIQMIFFLLGKRGQKGSSNDELRDFARRKNIDASSV